MASGYKAAIDLFAMKNLLFIHAHDVGRCLSPYGVKVPTPHLQDLAEKGVLFRHAHSAAPTCSPSRGAMWTGLSAHECGLLGLVHRGFDLQDRSLHLMAHLGKHGFHTVLAGVQHEFKAEIGPSIYDETLPLEDRSPETRDFHAAECAASFIHKVPDRPWALSLGLFYPHREFLPPQPGASNWVKVPEPLPDTAEVREDFAGYAASVAEMDRCVGHVLEALADSGQAAHTLVVFTTDHGIAFPDMKCNLTVHGTGVALLMSGPVGIPCGEVCDALVSHQDLPPTVCELLGVPAPLVGHGHSLLPLLAREANAVRTEVFSEINFHAAAEPARSIRTPEFNYIVRFDEDLRRPWANIDASLSKDLWKKLYAGQPLEQFQLFDVQRDPQERRNLAHDPAYSAVRADMEVRLRRWMEKTHDPLLQGPLLAPPGAVVNSRECFDP